MQQVTMISSTSGAVIVAALPQKSAGGPPCAQVSQLNTVHVF